ncbi:MAG: AAA family ATPase, partial [Eubacterium sp.]|nr:AAA family ATPase [Eubacterium sp.]
DKVKVEVSDDDVIVNPTFNYYLESEYGISLPEHEDGDTLAAYYSKVAAVVRRMGWDIIDECKLGIFSFLKINMYEDLKKNAGQILENGNVRALIGGTMPETEGSPGKENIPGPDSTSVKEEIPGLKRTVGNPLIDLHTVVDADSSQIEAIEMAKSGKSFVLQGPPGTGKSQTITNIIAECLHDGKKVLFVSEKQAALNVVYEKLKKAGLADFCLELHSHKANKKAVIEELNRILEMPKSSVSSGAKEEIRQKQESQLKLDTYALALHQKR